MGLQTFYCDISAQHLFGPCLCLPSAAPPHIKPILSLDFAGVINLVNYLNSHTGARTMLRRTLEFRE